MDARNYGREAKLPSKFTNSETGHRRGKKREFKQTTAQPKRTAGSACLKRI